MNDDKLNPPTFNPPVFDPPSEENKVNPFDKVNPVFDPEKDVPKALTSTDHLVEKAQSDNALLGKESANKFQSGEKAKLSDQDKLKWVRNVLTQHGVKPEDLDDCALQILGLLKA